MSPTAPGTSARPETIRHGGPTLLVQRCAGIPARCSAVVDAGFTPTGTGLGTNPGGTLPLGGGLGTPPNSPMGVAVLKGAPKPDISTPDAFKRALLAAKAVAYTDPGSGGASKSPDAKSRMHAVPSSLAVSTRFPSGLNSAQ